MKLITSVLTKDEIADLSKTYGDYVKITADIENKAVVVGVELHADAEAMLLEKGGKINDLWGGGNKLMQQRYIILDQY